MRTTIVLFLSSLLISGSLPAQKFTVLHTNDMHSRLMGFAPSSDYSPETTGDDKTRGGFARLDGYFNQVEKELGEKPLILDGGDFLMGTLFQTLEPQYGYQLRLMKKMGYDVVAIGNHEFDLGIDQLGNIIQNASARGEIPHLVLSNIQFNPAETKDDLLEEMFRKKLVNPYFIMDYTGLKIGFFGLLGVDAADVAPFVKPAQITDRLVAAQEMTTFLKGDQKVDVVICLSHSGVSKDKKGAWTGEDVELAKEVEGIDLIISGHTHTHIFDQLVVNNTPIVQAGSEGQFVGRIDLEWKDGKLISYGSKLTVMDDQILGSPEIQKDIEGYEKMVIDEVFSELDLLPGKTIAETNFDLTFNEQGNMDSSNLGPFVSDAIHWYVNQRHHSDITLAVGGLIRDNILVGSSGQQLANDLFRVTPLGSGVYDTSPGYSLSQVYLTGREVKNVFEAMLLAPKMSTSNYPFWSGVKFTYNPRRMMLDQVHEISIGNETDGYQKIDLSKKNEKLYCLTTNNYVLEFFGLVSEVTFGLLKVVPKDEYGQVVDDLRTLVVDGDPDQEGLQEMKEWEAMIRYASHFDDSDGNGIPNIPDYYLLPHLRGDRNPSLNPVALWGNGNGIMAGVSLVALSVLALTGLLIIL